jgi:hypothetical protein
MKLKKHFTFKSKHQVWRILISESDKLIIEVRDTLNRQAFFNCYYLNSGKKIFESFQLEEKFWIGIESIYNDIIFFHKFSKPDMPGHKQIIAFDINEQKVLWENENFIFSFIQNSNVFCYSDGFDGRYYAALNHQTGEKIMDFGINNPEINTLQKQAELEDRSDHYVFPNKFIEGSCDEKASKIINNTIINLDIVGDVEYNIYKDLLLFNFHSKVLNSIINKFYAVCLSSNKILFSDIISSKLNAFVPDTFFVYKEFLIMLKERNGVLVYKLV